MPIEDVTLVAAHAWDVAGALAAGCRAAFVARRACRATRSTAPDFVGTDIDEIADLMLAG